MTKKAFCVFFTAFFLISVIFAGCGTKVPARIVHCDRCGKEIKIPEDSNMTEDWIIYCSECEKELGLDDLVPDTIIPN